MKKFFFPLQTMICKRKPLIKMNLKLKLDSFMENQLWITSLLKTCPQTYKSYHMKNIFPLLSVNPRRVCIVASEERQREYIQNPKLRKTGVDTWINNFFLFNFFNYWSLWCSIWVVVLLGVNSRVGHYHQCLDIKAWFVHNWPVSENCVTAIAFDHLVESIEIIWG